MMFKEKNAKKHKQIIFRKLCEHKTCTKLIAGPSEINIDGTDNREVKMRKISLILSR